MNTVLHSVIDNHDAPETGKRPTSLDPSDGYVTIINTYVVAPERAKACDLVLS